MSVIFDAMLVVPYGEAAAIDRVNAALFTADTSRHQQFAQCQMDDAGGNKVFCTDVYAAAFNHLLPSVVRAAVLAAPWHNPAAVLYIQNLTGDYEADLVGRAVSQWRELVPA